MKKAIALLATLVVLTSTAFAQLAPTISGEIETQWGIDFNADDGAGTADSASGFENDTDITITIPLATDASLISEGEGATGYGEITGAYIELNLEDFSFGDYDDDEAVFDEDGDYIYSDGITGSEGDIYGKLDFGNGLYIEIGDASGLSANLAEGDTDYKLDPDFDEGAGMSIGFTNDMASIEFTIANEDDGYEVDEEDDEDYYEDDYDTDFFADEVYEVTNDEADSYSSTGDTYMIGGAVSYTAGDIFSLSAEFGTNMTGSNDDTVDRTGVAVEVSTMIGPLSLTVPFDYLSKEATLAGTYGGTADTDTATAMELMPEVEVTIDALTLGVGFHYLTIAESLINSEIEDYNVVVTALNTAGDDLDLASYFTEDYTAQTLMFDVAYALEAGTFGIGLDYIMSETVVDGDDDDSEFELELTWDAADYSLEVEFDDLLADEYMFNDINLDATYTGVAGVSVSIETEISVDAATEFELDDLTVDFTEELTGLENTTITLNWQDVLTSTDDMGEFYVGCAIAF